MPTRYYSGPSKVVRIPLSFEQSEAVDRHRTYNCENKTSFAVSSLYLLLALQRQNITDGDKPFQIDGELYTPPPFTRGRDVLLQVHVPIHLLTEAESGTESQPLSQAVFMAKCINFKSDLCDFVPSGTYMASSGESRLLVRAFTPEEEIRTT